MSWDWSNLASVIFGAGFGTAVAQLGVPAYRDWRNRKRQAAYMAMRLAVVLEAFASDCVGIIQDNSEAAREAGGDLPDYRATLPELASYPDDAEGWRVISRKLAGRCLNLRNRIKESQTGIDSTFKFADADAGAEEVAKRASGRGLEAWDLAVALRREYRIEAIDTVWDWVQVLREHKAETRNPKPQAALRGSSLWTCCRLYMRRSDVPRAGAFRCHDPIGPPAAAARASVAQMDQRHVAAAGVDDGLRIDIDMAQAAGPAPDPDGEAGA